MRILLIAMLFFAPAAAQQAEPQGETRSGPPTIQRSTGGIVMIKGSSRPAPPAGEPPAAEGATAPAVEGEAGAEKKAEEKPAASPRRREVSRSSYGVNGGRSPQGTQQSTVRGNDTAQTVVTLSSINGRTVPYLKDSEKAVKKTGAAQTVERRTQRYDAAGRPTQQEVIVEEKKTLPGGGSETVATRYIEDVNGSMQPAERIVTRETKQGATARTVIAAERVDSQGRFQAVSREESVDKETAAGHQIETVRFADNGAGSMREVEREKSTLTQSGENSTTTGELWKRNPVNDRIELMEKVEGQLRKSASGVEQETVRTYGYASASGAANINATRMELQELVQREVRPSASGGQVVNTTVQGRDPGDNSQMGRKIVTQEVTTPGAKGETVETQVFEQGVNGRLQATSVTVEKVEK